MKKYLMFMFCLVFAVSLVSCRKKGTRQVNSEDPTKSLDAELASNPDALMHTGGEASTGDAGSGEKLVNKFSQSIGVGTELIFDGYELLDNDTKCQILISRPGSDEKLNVNVTVANHKTESMQANAVEIGVFDDDDNNILFIAVDKVGEKIWLESFCGTTTDCVESGNCKDMPACVGQCTLTTLNTHKRLTFVRNVYLQGDTKTAKTTHLWWMNVSNKQS